MGDYVSLKIIFRRKGGDLLRSPPLVNPRPMATSVRVSRPVVWVVAVVFRSASGQGPCRHPAVPHIFPAVYPAGTMAAGRSAEPHPAAWEDPCSCRSASGLDPCHHPAAVRVGYPSASGLDPCHHPGAVRVDYPSASGQGPRRHPAAVGVGYR